MFLQRALVTFTLGPLGLLLMYLGGWFYAVPVAAILLIATFEYSQLTASLGWRTPVMLLVPAVLVQWFLPQPVQNMLLQERAHGTDLAAPALLLSLLLALTYALWLYERRPSTDALGTWLATSCGVVFLGWLGSHFLRIRGVEEMAFEWTAVTIVTMWTADSGAYVFGKSLGRRKLAPYLSPNKTIEGYLGGIGVGTASAVLIAVLLRLPPWHSLILGILVSALGPIGDLGVSMMKRAVGVKDSGNFLPGHGGALDRIDSLVWAVAIGYYFILLVG